MDIGTIQKLLTVPLQGYRTVRFPIVFYTVIDNLVLVITSIGMVPVTYWYHSIFMHHLKDMSYSCRTLKREQNLIENDRNKYIYVVDFLPMGHVMLLYKNICQSTYSTVRDAFSDSLFIIVRDKRTYVSSISIIILSWTFLLDVSF